MVGHVEGHLMKPLGALLAASAMLTAGASAREFHVAIGGNDYNDGSAAQPFRTISAAAQVAQPGGNTTRTKT